MVTQKEGFRIRNEYKENPDRFECPECGQKLLAANSSNDNVYFRHFGNSDYCLLKDENVDDEIIADHYRFLYERESQRHKELKNRIGNALSKVDQVSPDSIVIDSRFIIKNGDKRKPDVYCMFGEYELVFEIQLSPMSPRFIHHRLKFYIENGIYVLWILDLKGSPYLLNNMQRDIKYIFDNQNLFSLNEESTTLQLFCNYKWPFIHESSEVREKWMSQEISLNDLKFNAEKLEVFFFDYGKEKILLEEWLVQAKAEVDKERRIIKDQERREEMKRLLDKISLYWKNDYNCFGLISELTLLSLEEVNVLNSLIKMNGYHKGRPILCYYFSSYKLKRRVFKTNFIEFLLSQREINFKVNDKDQNGSGALVELYLNQDLRQINYKLIPLLFNHGYKFCAFDRNFLMDNPALYSDKPDVEILKLGYYNMLGNWRGDDPVRKNLRYLLFIESALQNRIIGTGVKSWVQVLIPVLSGFKQFWTYTKTVLAKTGLNDVLTKVDAKGTVQKKILDFELEEVDQDRDFIHILYQLYPEIFLR